MQKIIFRLGQLGLLKCLRLCLLPWARPPPILPIKKSTVGASIEKQTLPLLGMALHLRDALDHVVFIKFIEFRTYCI